MRVTTISLPDINDKEQLYIRIENELGTEKVNINVGQKTFDSVKKVIEAEERWTTNLKKTINTPREKEEKPIINK